LLRFSVTMASVILSYLPSELVLKSFLLANRA